MPSNQSFDLTQVMEVFQTSFRLILEYPFFSKEIIPLTKRDSKLKQVFHEFREQCFQDIESILSNLVQSGQMQLRDQEMMLGNLVEMIWVLAFFWTPYLEMSEQPLDQNNVERGVVLVLKLLEPYFILSED